MSGSDRSKRRYRLFLLIMLILLAGAVALFVYGSMTNGLTVPAIPGRGLFALRTMWQHG